MFELWSTFSTTISQYFLIAETSCASPSSSPTARRSAWPSCATRPAAREAASHTSTRREQGQQRQFRESQLSRGDSSYPIMSLCPTVVSTFLGTIHKWHTHIFRIWIPSPLVRICNCEIHKPSLTSQDFSWLPPPWVRHHLWMVPWSYYSRVGRQRWIHLNPRRECELLMWIYSSPQRCKVSPLRRNDPSFPFCNSPELSNLF